MELVNLKLNLKKWERACYVYSEMSDVQIAEQLLDLWADLAVFDPRSALISSVMNRLERAAGGRMSVQDEVMIQETLAAILKQPAGRRGGIDGHC